ncbi:MAG: sialidase family protein [Armatimonadota bacterium]|nr:sialidase family protein [Armatimonadota bacterium]
MSVDYQIDLRPITSGFDGETCWVHARAGAIPGAGEEGRPAVVTTMQKLLLSGSDVFYTIHDMRTDDLGESWTGPSPHEGLGRWDEGGGVTGAVCDVTPGWHAATQTLLATGHTVYYRDDTGPVHVRPRATAYSVYDPDARTWSAARLLEMPEEQRFVNAGAGCTQRFDLGNGTILLPIYFRPDVEEAHSEATVLRCAFDGETLQVLEMGNALACEDPRGMGEPSITRFQDRYYLTLRNDVRGYVSVSDDGLHFEEPVAWRFDDGEELGSYNTQAHWLTHSDALHLVYTRRGLDNDHVFRHRAPLLAAEVDPERLCVIRDTERVAVPERGARLGNFGVCEVSENESWIIAAEWMQPAGCEEYGSDNTVWAARILWDRPNRGYRA